MALGPFALTHLILLYEEVKFVRARFLLVPLAQEGTHQVLKQILLYFRRFDLLCLLLAHICKLELLHFGLSDRM